MVSINLPMVGQTLVGTVFCFVADAFRLGRSTCTVSLSMRLMMCSTRTATAFPANTMSSDFDGLSVSSFYFDN